MRFEFTAEELAWRDEVRDFIKDNMTPELEQEVLESDGVAKGPLAKKFLEKVAEKGWIGVGWPKEYGGMGYGMVKQFIFLEEMQYALAPRIGMTLTSLAPTIMRFGSEEMKKEWIPRIVRGEVELALGYSEPEAGTDLANLKTRAVLDGDEYVINGHKLWNSEAHVATHEFLACRTDPQAPKHKGISIILVPIDHPGVTVRPIDTWGDVRTNEVFFDNVRVPRKNLLGEPNKGWSYAMNALALERFDIASVAIQRRLLDELVKYLKETVLDGRVLARDTVIRHRVAGLFVELEVGKMLFYLAAWKIDQGEVPVKEAAMGKIFSSELRAKVCDVGMQVMSLYGQLRTGSRRVPVLGLIERYYRIAPFYRFGGGTNEILRDIIAQRGLGLPRGKEG